MSFAFAGLDVATLGGQLDTVERFCVVLANLADTKKLENGLRLVREETQRHLQAMADLTKAEQAWAAAQAAAKAEQERAVAEITRREQDLARRENELAARDAAITQREQQWRETVAAVRGLAA
jgi:hypothetical protein